MGLPVLPHISMSTTCTMTALAVRDQTLGDGLEIANHICILVATQGVGTPFSPSSFQEEDMVKLCMGLDQVHLEGLLWLSDTEMVFVLCSGSQMMATMHLFAAAMVWHDDPIKLCICHPTGTQVREYMAMRVRHPCGTQAQIPGGEVVSQSSPVSSTLKRGPSHNSTWPSGTSVITN